MLTLTILRKPLLHFIRLTFNRRFFTRGKNFYFIAAHLEPMNCQTHVNCHADCALNFRCGRRSPASLYIHFFVPAVPIEGEARGLEIFQEAEFWPVTEKTAILMIASKRRMDRP